MERQPYFQVGEEVILQSKHFPQVNGDYIIEDLEWMENHVSSATGEKLPSMFVYSLINCDGQWAEFVLKKKYPPSSQGFNELISSVKQNEHA